MQSCISTFNDPSYVPRWILYAHNRLQLQLLLHSCVKTNTSLFPLDPLLHYITLNYLTRNSHPLSPSSALSSCRSKVLHLCGGIIALFWCSWLGYTCATIELELGLVLHFPPWWWRTSHFLTQGSRAQAQAQNHHYQHRSTRQTISYHIDPINHESHRCSSTHSSLDLHCDWQVRRKEQVRRRMQPGDYPEVVAV